MERSIRKDSISSKQMMQGALSRACWNTRTRFFSDSPTYMFRKLLAFTTISFIFVSLAMIRAIVVLPVPGGPNSSRPFTGAMPAFTSRSYSRLSV